MGGGDLNMKKSWHPLLIKNQERVWKEEQKALEEQKKLNQLRKEKEEERQLQELRQIQATVGGRREQERLDWMYAAGPNQSSSAKAEEMEDYLLGKKRVDSLIEQGTSMSILSADSKEIFSSISNPNANTYRDTQAKIREDPLFLIKKTEQANIKSIVSNPLKMREIQEDLHKERSKKYHKKRPFADSDDADSVRSIEQDRNNRSQKRSRESKIFEMMNDAKKISEERKKRVEQSTKEEYEEEKKLDEDRRRRGMQSDFLKNAYKSAYSSHSSIGLGERLQRHRGTSQKISRED
ncbi:11547_t:CDS:2 [Funneliformis caledonium]|uniref:11547_t:CDS:1 n=1 Tax=Funneliformis caledonium TaxID=1117310 RepID=A0A9N9ANR9_9GLOM|nr:11547_t:CDS:2 [Funneliformis caledonium]